MTYHGENENPYCKVSPCRTDRERPAAKIKEVAAPNNFCTSVPVELEVAL